MVEAHVSSFYRLGLVVRILVLVNDCLFSVERWQQRPNALTVEAR